VKGRNGSGKSTLLKISAGLLAPDSGSVAYGKGVKVGYFSQDVYGLDLSSSGYTTLSSLFVEDERIYKAAKSMGLSPKLLHRRIADLSRGQQAKVGFLRLLLAGYDVLILDEPTNHLDIATKESIERALADYHGALIIASHDTYFVDRLTVTQEIYIDSNGRSDLYKQN
jgi:ATP-binding cassette subfamily F protein 3